MTYLLDTDVVSQLCKQKPHAGAYRWIQSQRDEDVFLSAVTLFELRFGVQEMARGAKRGQLESFVSDAMTEKFLGRILPVTAEVADLGAHLFSRSLHEKRGMDTMDAMIAATVIQRSMVLATLNRRHFEWLGIPLVSF